MLTFEKIKNNPRVFRSLTRLTLEAFTQLVASFEQAYEAYLDEQDWQRKLPLENLQGLNTTRSI